MEDPDTITTYMFGMYDEIGNYTYNENFSTDFMLNYDVTNLTHIIRDLHNDLYRHQDPFTIFLILVYGVVFILGLVGNVFVIVVVARHRAMQTLTNVFFLNLTFGDLFVVFICIPITLGNYVYRDWIYGEIFCKVTTFLQGTAVGISVLSMLFISVNRYFAIHVPLKAKILFTRTKVALMLVLIWLLSFGVVSPLLYVNELTTWGIPDIFESRICEEKWNHLADKQLYNVFIFVVQFLLPLAVMAAMYTKISQTLWREDHTLYDGITSGKKQSMRVLKQRRRTVRNLIVLVNLFALSWLPYYIANIWMDFNVDSEYATVVLNYVYPVAQLLGLSNSTINPLCYCFLSNGFRKALFNMCFKKKRMTSSGKIVTLRFKLHHSDDSGFESNETAMT